MGLLGTAAKAYVATRVVGATHRRQQQRWAANEQAQAAPVPAAPAAPAPAAPAPAAPAPSGASMLDQLEQLGKLRAAGVLTEAEFEVQKHRLLTGN